LALAVAGGGFYRRQLAAAARLQALKAPPWAPSSSARGGQLLRRPSSALLASRADAPYGRVNPLGAASPPPPSPLQRQFSLRGEPRARQFSVSSLYTNE